MSEVAGLISLLNAIVLILQQRGYGMAKQQVLNSKQSNGSNGANLGFETKMWAAADKLRNNMDAAEYKHVVLGLIFL